MPKLTRTELRLCLFTLLLLPSSLTLAEIWRDLPVAAKHSDARPVYYRSLSADHNALRQTLAAAPPEFTSSQGVELSLPMPDGELQRFRVENSPVMAPELAARYPEIQTYRVRGLDDPGASGRLDMTPKGFHGMLSTAQGVVYIDPDGSGAYRSYFKRDYLAAMQGQADLPSRHCGVAGSTVEAAARPLPEIAFRSSGQRRVYRLAVAATGEYTQYHGGTVADGLNAIVTTINRVNQIYGRDLALHFSLVANNDAIIYTNAATDPYTNLVNTTALLENQENLDEEIGPANYDIGHLFERNQGGGLASVAVACLADFKAQGVTGSPVPDGEVFNIDLVAHELGHQLAANHTFNGTSGACASGRIPATAVEPGSGSTVMAYAGICLGENLQDHSDATFHAMSIQEIVGYTTSGQGRLCGGLITTGNTAPTVTVAAPSSVIPKGTPFTLTGAATDPDGDALSYQWDEMDAGATATDANTFGADLGDNPLFRSFLPQNTPLRNLPRLSNLLANTTDPGEVLPETNRTLNFRLTVRDGESGVAEADVSVAVVDTAGPFSVAELDPNVNMSNVGTYPISWNVAETDAAPINCARVDIDLLAFSPNASSYCEYRLATGVLNIGSTLVSLAENHATDRGRIRVRCSDSIFFDINDAFISVDAPTAAASDCISSDGTVFEHDTIFDDEAPVVTTDSGGGGGAQFYLTLLLGLALSARLHSRRGC